MDTEHRSPMRWWLTLRCAFVIRLLLGEEYLAVCEMVACLAVMVGRFYVYCHLMLCLCSDRRKNVGVSVFYGVVEASTMVMMFSFEYLVAYIQEADDVFIGIVISDREVIQKAALNNQLCGFISNFLVKLGFIRVLRFLPKKPFPNNHSRDDVKRASRRPFLCMFRSLELKFFLGVFDFSAMMQACLIVAGVLYCALLEKLETTCMVQSLLDGVHGCRSWAHLATGMLTRIAAGALAGVVWMAAGGIGNGCIDYVVSIMAPRAQEAK
nr:hypothetical protein Iba_chr04dCG13480 [Ipomoea batatas]